MNRFCVCHLSSPTATPSASSVQGSGSWMGPEVYETLSQATYRLLGLIKAHKPKMPALIDMKRACSYAIYSCEEWTKSGSRERRVELGQRTLPNIVSHEYTYRGYMHVPYGAVDKLRQLMDKPDTTGAMLCKEIFGDNPSADEIKKKSEECVAACVGVIQQHLPSAANETYIQVCDAYEQFRYEGQAYLSPDELKDSIRAWGKQQGYLVLFRRYGGSMIAAYVFDDPRFNTIYQQYRDEVKKHSDEEDKRLEECKAEKTPWGTFRDKKFESSKYHSSLLIPILDKQQPPLGAALYEYLQIYASSQCGYAYHVQGDFE